MGSPFQFYLLGELQVARAGRLLPTPPHRSHGILAALLLQPGPQHRQHLINQLFPDLPEHTGLRRLSDLLWLLRHAMPDLPLTIHVHEICLPTEARWLDVEQFRRCAASGAAGDWLSAVALYRGDLLEGTSGEWLLVEREALYLAYVRTSHKACAALISEGRFDQAIPLAERLVRGEPYDEGALRSLMTAYHAVGRRGAALAAYERFVNVAADELGAAPEAATHALAAALRNTAPPAARALGCGTPCNDPEALLARGRWALARGDWAVLDTCLARLNEEPDCRADARLLAVDLALARDSGARAEILLAAAQPWRAAERGRAAQAALLRHAPGEAREMAVAALIEAGDEGDAEAELHALLVLVNADRQLGRVAAMMRSADQALILARRLDQPPHVVRALIARGIGQYYHGSYARALAHFCEARSIAREHGLRLLLGTALQGVRLVQCNTGKVMAALATLGEELDIWRDLGLARREAEALEGLALVYDLLGHPAESLRALSGALEISERIGDPVRIAISRYNLACSLVYHDDGQAPRAVAEASAALTVFRAHGQFGREAANLTILGYAHWVAGEPAEAAAVLDEAVAACARAGELHRMAELRAYQALACLDMGEAEQGLAYAQQGLLAMAEGEVSREVAPDIYYASAAACAAVGNTSQARLHLERAYRVMLEDAGQLEDEDARQAFFHRSPTARRLMAALHGQNIAPVPGQVITRRLPATAAQRAIQVHWTVDAGPPDAALKQARGAIALRRARLARLLQEAQQQGGRASSGQLAEALGVSSRTVQRDLAALAQGR